MSAEFLRFAGKTKANISIDSVLDGAKDGELEEVLVIGLTKSGEFFMASNTSYRPDNVYLLQRALHEFMCMAKQAESE